MKKIIRNGTIVTATDTYKADILIDENKIMFYAFADDFQ